MAGNISIEISTLIDDTYIINRLRSLYPTIILLFNPFLYLYRTPNTFYTETAVALGN